MNPLFRFFILAALLPPVFVFSQPGAGVSAGAAEQYVLWAEQAIGEGRWDQALAALERGADFAAESSDVSYLLAEVRCHENLPLLPALDDLRRAFDAGRWDRYAPSQGRLLEAETLIRLRNYSGALRSLDLAGQDPGAGAKTVRGGTGEAPRSGGQYAAILRLLALKGLSQTEEFLRFLAVVMDRYPRDPRPPEILFSWAYGRMPEDGLPLARTDRALVDLALRRLPLFLEGWNAEAPESYPPGSRLRGISASSRLGYLAASFIRDTGEARRLVSACRALGADRESLPISLDLGLIDDRQAVEELFESAGSSPPVLDRDTLRRVWSLTRSPEGRDLFRRGLLEFSGLIITDADRDGLREEWTRYSSGTPLEYCRDADQDGREDLRVVFSAGGIPLRAEEGRVRVEWERYPAVLQAELDGTRYIPAPETMFYAPIRFSPLAGDAGVPGPEAGTGPFYPEAEIRSPRLTERTLVSFALNVVRPSAEFPGGIEYLELDQGVPRRAVEVFEGKTVSLTEFVLGRPRVQRLDLDLDGRMETIRRFREGAVSEENPLVYEKILESVETDRDRDGLYETGERFFPDGTSVYSWDTNGDGARDYSETRGNSAR
jgi:hypothetical protein